MNANAKPSSDNILEGVKRLREHLTTTLGSHEVAFKALDTNGNGAVSLGEIRDTCSRMKIDLAQITGIKDFIKVFSALDSSGQGGLDIEDLFVREPKIKEVKDATTSSGGLKRQDTRKISVATVSSVKSTNSIEIPVNIDIFDSLVFFRQGLVKKFGSEQLAFKALDTNANGLLSFSEVKDSLMRHNLKLETLCGVNNNELHKIFQLMDVDKSGELTFWELMHSDPYEEKLKTEAEKTRREAEKKQKESEAVAKAIAAKAAADKIAQETLIAQKKAAEDEAVLEQAKEQPNLPHYVLFRNFLLQRFGNPKVAMRALDINGNGLLSLGEIIQSLQRLHINLEKELDAKFDMKDVFKLLDVDSSGELTFFELFRCNPEQERARLREERKRELLENKKERELQEAMTAAQDQLSHLQPGLSGTVSGEEMEINEQVMLFRSFLLDLFGSTEAAFEALDVDGNGMLSFGELRVSLERLEVSVKEVVSENANLMNIFRKLDANKRGEISLQQLMINDPGTKERKRKKKRTKTVGGSNNKLKELDESEMSVHLLRILTFIRKPKLKELNLRWGHIGKDGARRLAAAIHDKGEVRQMTLLQLEGNYMTSDGLRPLADSIENFCHLERLVLSWNGLDNLSAEILAFTISKIKQLTLLDLSHNHISDQGAQNLARSIGNQHAKVSLKILNMESNLMGRFGIEELNYACRGKKIDLKVQGNLPESTSGCNIVESGRPDSNQSSRPPSSRQRSIIITPASEKPEPKSPSSMGDTVARTQANAHDFGMKSIKVAADLRHFTYCWSADAGFSIPRGTSMKKLLSEARREAKNIETQRKIEEEEMAMADANSEDITQISIPLPGIGQQPKFDASGRNASRPLSVPSDVKSQSVGNDSSRSKLTRSVSQGRLDSRSQSAPSSPSDTGRLFQTRYRETGIALDYKQKPAGDSWKVGLELQKKLTNAKLVGLGKAASSRLLSQSQPSLGAHQR